MHKTRGRQRLYRQKCAQTSPQPELSQQGSITQCARRIQHVLDVLTAHQGHQQLWNRSPLQPCAS